VRKAKHITFSSIDVGALLPVMAMPSVGGLKAWPLQAEVHPHQLKKM